MAIAYFSDTRRTVAAKLDEAWDDYRNQSHTAEERKEAMQYMIYVFDIHHFSDEPDLLNGIVTELMEKREQKKSDNPNYIPLLATGRYPMDEHTKILESTQWSGDSDDPTIQEAFYQQTLLDVNQPNKDQDFNALNARKLTYLSHPEDRIQYNVEISNGLFCQFGKPFDSSNRSAHDKKSYVAFTLNLNGELSVFSHLSGRKDEQTSHILVHSSMNAGAPVLIAGEMQLKNGKLLSINTYSGHYQPSLFSVARFLEYVSNRGVDISETKVYLQGQDPQQLGLSIPSRMVKISGDTNEWREINATHLVNNTNVIINKNIQSIDGYLNSRKTQFNLLFSDRMKAKVDLAREFRDELIYVTKTLKLASSVDELKQSLNVLDSIIARYEQKHQSLSQKSGRLKTHFVEMKEQLQTFLKETDQMKETDKEEKEKKFKKLF